MKLVWNTYTVEQCSPEDVFHLFLHHSPSPHHPHISLCPISTAALWSWRRLRRPKSFGLCSPPKEWWSPPEASTFPRVARTTSIKCGTEENQGDTLGLCQVLSSSLLLSYFHFSFQIWFILCWRTADGCPQVLLLLWTSVCPQTKVWNSNIWWRIYEIRLKGHPHHHWHCDHCSGTIYEESVKSEFGVHLASKYLDKLLSCQVSIKILVIIITQS